MKRVFALFFSLVFVLLSRSRSAAEASSLCEKTRTWQSYVTLEKTNLTPLQLGEYYQQKEREQLAAAQALFQLYLNGQAFVGRDIEACLKNHPERQNFLNSLNAVFISESFKLLQSAKGPHIQKLLKNLGLQNSVRIPLIHTVNSSLAAMPFEFKAGFHRGSSSVTLDLDRLAPSEWMIVFVHELLHSIDGHLKEDMLEYARPQVPQKLYEWYQAKRGVESLTQSERDFLHPWFMAALGRGLFAEYRTWVPTLLIYQEGLQEGLWQKVTWIEDILADRKANEDFKQFVYRYIDERAFDPTEKIFSIPLAQGYLRDLRQRIRSEQWLPELNP